MDTLEAFASCPAIANGTQAATSAAMTSLVAVLFDLLPGTVTVEDLSCACPFT
jgi:hypothetical protein